MPHAQDVSPPREVRGRRLLLGALVAAYIAYTTVLLYLSTTLAPYNQLFKAFFLVLFMVGAMWTTRFPLASRPLRGDVKAIFVLYVLFIAYTAFLCPFSEMPTASFVESVKYYFRILFFFTLVIWALHLRDRHGLIAFPIAAGTIFAIQALVLYAFLNLGVPVELRDLYLYEAAQEQKVWGVGLFGVSIFGLAGAFDPSLQTSFAIRLQSFFVEPSKFAMFLLYPMFLAYGYYRVRGQVRYLLYAAAMTLACIGTASIGAYIAAAGAGLVMLYFRVRPRIVKGLRTAVVLVSIGLIAWAGYAIFEWSANFVPQDAQDYGLNRILGFGAGGSLAERQRTDAELFEVFLDNPRGLSLINPYNSALMGFGDLGTPNAAMFIMVRTGVLGALLMLGVFTIVYVRSMLPQLRAECLGRYACIGTIAVWIHSLSYGTWLDLNLFLSLAVVLAMRDDPVFPSPRAAVAPVALEEQVPV